MSFDFDPRRALPNRAFRDPAWHDAERDRIWQGDWVFVGTEDAVADPGDRLPVTIGAQPVLVSRTQRGDLVALSNLCAHRGTVLVEEPGNAKRIQCPYHAWTYDDGGRLLSAPFSSAGELDKTEHCLPSYRIESWHGLVFVSLDRDVEPLSERFARVDRLLVDRGIDGLHHWSAHEETDVWACNWKLAAINAMESYHLFEVHRDTLEPVSPTKSAYWIDGSWRATATGGASGDDDDYLLVSLPPGFVGVMTRGSFVWQAITPLSPESCKVRTGGAFSTPSPERAESKLSSWLTRTASAAIDFSLPDFLPEDKAICERGQRGAVGDFEPGLLLDIERVVIDFGNYLNKRINDIDA